MARGIRHAARALIRAWPLLYTAAVARAEPGEATDGGVPVVPAADGGARETVAESQDGGAMPTLDVSAEAARDVTEDVYATSQVFVHNVGEKSSEKLVMPSGRVEIGGELVFLTSAGIPSNQPTPSAAAREDLGFTDLTLVRAKARRAFGDSVEVFLATELLAKQPTRMDELPWQEAILGTRVAVGGPVAVEVAGSGGPLLDRQGAWWAVDPRLVAKFKAGEYLRFAVDAGDSFTALEVSRASSRFWLDELARGAEAQFGDDQGALWVRTGYDVPIAKSPTPLHPDPSTHLALDPQVRVSFQVGGA